MESVVYINYLIQKIIVDIDNILKSCLWGIVQEELDIYTSCAIAINRGTHSQIWHEARNVFASQSTLGAPCFTKKVIGLFPSVPGKQDKKIMTNKNP
jgi:hypothetical protein